MIELNKGDICYVLDQSGSYFYIFKLMAARDYSGYHGLAASFDVLWQSSSDGRKFFKEKRVSGNMFPTANTVGLNVYKSGDKNLIRRIFE